MDIETEIAGADPQGAGMRFRNVTAIPSNFSRNGSQTRGCQASRRLKDVRDQVSESIQKFFVFPISFLSSDFVGYSLCNFAPLNTMESGVITGAIAMNSEHLPTHPSKRTYAGFKVMLNMG